ncbi:ATP-binding cassette domain-containing protein [Streptomyces sp. NPDC087850]|uniref:ABC transporter ATP-binding protein n=1 Tax=Streptomyces sp. NPDC087850 TaxID=3365809 RepID=UPI00380E6AFC
MKLQGVGRRYGLGGPWVLRGVDLGLTAGTLVRVEGGNGSGKSTLLRLLAGIDTPTEGQLTDRLRTAYVPERFPVSMPFTAAGYLVNLGRVHGLSSAVAADRAVEWLDRFGAGEHARTQMSELSKGTSQKVAVAQALLAEAELLVLDEAWTGLDAMARTELDLAVRERVAAGGTVVFVDHDPRRLAGVADEVYAVTDLTLVRREGEDPVPADDDGPRVRIVAAGPEGALPPAGLPGAPVCEPGEDGSVLLSAEQTYSDELLRALLTARPAWHIREVRTEAVPLPGTAPSPVEPSVTEPCVTEPSAAEPSTTAASASEASASAASTSGTTTGRSSR